MITLVSRFFKKVCTFSKQPMIYPCMQSNNTILKDNQKHTTYFAKYFSWGQITKKTHFKKPAVILYVRYELPTIPIYFRLYLCIVVHGI